MTLHQIGHTVTPPAGQHDGHGGSCFGQQGEVFFLLPKPSYSDGLRLVSLYKDGLIPWLKRSALRDHAARAAYAEVPLQRTQHPRCRRDDRIRVIQSALHHDQVAIEPRRRIDPAWTARRRPAQQIAMRRDHARHQSRQGTETILTGVHDVRLEGLDDAKHGGRGRDVGMFVVVHPLKRRGAGLEVKLRRRSAAHLLAPRALRFGRCGAKAHQHNRVAALHVLLDQLACKGPHRADGVGRHEDTHPRMLAGKLGRALLLRGSGLAGWSGLHADE